MQLRQIKYALPTGADQRVIAGQLAAAESMRARFKSCADLANGVQGANVTTLQDYKTASLAQPARLLVTNAKVGQMTPPTITQAAVELYAVCGKRSAAGDSTAREQAQRQLMSQEMGLRAERLLRDVRAEAFIEVPLGARFVLAEAPWLHRTGRTAACTYHRRSRRDRTGYCAWRFRRAEARGRSLLSS